MLQQLKDFDNISVAVAWVRLKWRIHGEWILTPSFWNVDGRDERGPQSSLEISNELLNREKPVVVVRAYQKSNGNSSCDHKIEPVNCHGSYAKQAVHWNWRVLVFRIIDHVEKTKNSHIFTFDCVILISSIHASHQNLAESLFSHGIFAGLVMFFPRAFISASPYQQLAFVTMGCMTRMRTNKSFARLYTLNHSFIFPHPEFPGFCIFCGIPFPRPAILLRLMVRTFPSGLIEYYKHRVKHSRYVRGFYRDGFYEDIHFSQPTSLFFDYFFLIPSVASFFLMEVRNSPYLEREQEA